MLEFLPITAIIAITGWFVAFFSVRRHKNYDFFILKTEQQVHKLYGPLVMKMKDIVHTQKIEEKECKLDELVQILNGQDTPILLESSKVILFKCHLFTDSYVKYINNRSIDSEEIVWGLFYNLYDSLRYKLEDCRKIIFKDFDWRHELEKKNRVIRLLIIFTRGTYEISKSLSQLMLIVIFLALFEYVNSKLIGSPTYILPYIGTLISLSILCMLIWLLSYAYFRHIFRVNYEFLEPKREGKYIEDIVSNMKRKYKIIYYEKIVESNIKVHRHSRKRV